MSSARYQRNQGVCLHPYRVFISYSHLDVILIERLKGFLVQIGVTPVSDLDLVGGTRFSDEIKRQIAHAHIFISVLTANSQESPWVHQELGFALGLGLPVLTLALDKLPGGMSHELQAVKIRSDMSDLAQNVSARQLDLLVSTAQDARIALFQCADSVIERTQLLSEQAKHLYLTTGPCKLLQKAAFGSFSIPNRSVKHGDWVRREGGEATEQSMRALFRAEREWLERHAQEGGCDLIIDPYVVVKDGDEVNRIATVSRLETLLEFLLKMGDDGVRVVTRRDEIEGNLTILGDWLVADAVVPRYHGGFRQTVFTRHGPTVLARKAEFESEFEELFRETRGPEPSSKRVAQLLEDRIADIRKG